MTHKTVCDFVLCHPLIYPDDHEQLRTFMFDKTVSQYLKRSIIFQY